MKNTGNFFRKTRHFGGDARRDVPAEGKFFRLQLHSDSTLFAALPY